MSGTSGIETMYEKFFGLFFVVSTTDEVMALKRKIVGIAPGRSTFLLNFDSL